MGETEGSEEVPESPEPSSMPSRTFLTVFPMAEPILGRFFGPKITRTMTRMTASSGTPMPRIMRCLQ